jgi:ubiquinone/menaquinone biosynthesis C-methylase UbiE
VGSGSGYLLPYLSKAVGASGKVYAEEIQKEFLPGLGKRTAKLGNVKVVLGNTADPQLPPRSIDCFVLLTVYHEVQNPVAFLQRLRQSAKPGAKLAIIDFDPDRHGEPPTPGNHWVLEADVLKEAQAAGWRLAERFEFISSQFFLVFKVD